ncbi:CobW family GTP-binding protein [Curvivirga aplysinae]|uniref:CobW family GTP-binding protein n=1 Tax=Curvivirga aplysinae TaxID=2529852 RepID=UPI0012BD20F9|nr:GTP-binding protein [Curvivirga aplysinae]MTI11057.1 GTP-binding protein [Curvivirga aplysinae]
MKVTPVPVCVISGFLGAGKTTLLNNILNGDHGLNITVLVNDFGAIDIDSQLLAKQEGNTISLKNGCICCSLQNDLVFELQALLSNPDGPPEYIVIEASGVSDPSKIISALKYPQIRDVFQIDSVVTLIDVQTIQDLEGDVKHLAMSQLDTADIIVMNKVADVSKADLQRIHDDWLYPSARVIETNYSDVPLDILFSLSGRSKALMDSSNLKHEHSHKGLFHTWHWKSDQQIDVTKLRSAIMKLPKDIYRAKGVFFSDAYPDERVVLQVVGARQEWSKDQYQNQDRQSQLVMISMKKEVDMSAIQEQLDDCVLGSIAK